MPKQAKQAMPDAGRGFVFALFAYFLWGLFPFYMKAVEHIPVLEVLAHRAIWSVPVAAVLLLFIGRTKDVFIALRSPRTLAMACLTAALISVNWGVYVWSIFNDQALEAALGYYINPLFNVLLGAVFLQERLTKAQVLAVMLALAAVILLTIETGGLPWVSIVLPVTFGLYGFFRKSLPIGPAQGFMLEVLILLLPAGAYVVWLLSQGQDHFFTASFGDVLLLMLAGVITAVPLVLYATGAKLLRYSTLGLMQYITPTMLFFVAVFIFHEPFAAVQFYAFTLIWLGLVIYTWSSLRQGRSDKTVEVKAEASLK